MNTIKISAVILILAALFCPSCKWLKDAFIEYTPGLYNESAFGLYFYCPSAVVMSTVGSCVYPDTTICFGKLTEAEFVDAHGMKGIHSQAKYIESWFSCFPNDTISIFLFDEEIVETVPWETVVKEYLVLQRYDLSIEDFKRLDNDIHYPPTPEMRDIHMWPPYEEAVKMRQ